ncbi:MAG: sulfite exporter TauE/SafE family protein, partial [Gammaproteobacteria bacterium]|nr:sulfite exporter TauE/SafE family protein [Gammaproteobacteria bacterium]
MVMDWANTLTGFFVGLLVGATGVGGGSLMTPILVLLFGIAPTTAVGTDLWFAATTKVVGGAIHQNRGRVDWQVVGRLGLGSVPASLATLAWMHRTATAQVTSGLTLKALGVVLLLTAISMLFARRFQALGRAEHVDIVRWLQPVVTVLGGAVLGVLVTLTSVGAGALGTSLLRYLYPTRMKPAVLVATDIVHAIPLVMIAGSGYLIMGNVNLPLLGQLLLGSIPGIVVGSLVSGYMP